MNYPKMPPLNLYSKMPDYFKITFEYLPSLLKYYALKGMSLEQIKEMPDFQEAVFLSKQNNHPSHVDGWVSSWWGSLIYIWIYHNDMMPKIIALTESKTNDEWWSEATRGVEPYKKGIREHMDDLFGQEMSYRIIHSVAHDLADGKNKIVGLEYMEMTGCSHYDSRYQGMDKLSERERVLTYLKMLDQQFKNFQECLEEYYLEETSELQSAQTES